MFGAGEPGPSEGAAKVTARCGGFTSNPILVSGTGFGGGGGGGGGAGFDGTYSGTFATTSPIEPSGGPITINVSGGEANLVPPADAFGGTVNGSGAFTGFWNNCPGAGCVDFPISGMFSTPNQFQITGQNGSGSESVTITLTKE